MVEISQTSEVLGNTTANSPADLVLLIQTTEGIFHISSVELCAPVVTLSTNDKIKFLECIKQGSKKQFLEI